MKTIMMEMPNRWRAGNCKVCTLYVCRWQGVKQKVDFLDCPFSSFNPQEAFEKTSVEMCACVVAKDKGNTVKLFAVEDKQ
jgi:hypothetical protein